MRFSQLPAEKRDAFAASLLGLTVAQAEQRASEVGCSILDRTEPGWYAGVLDRRRVGVVTEDGVIVTATVG